MSAPAPPVVLRWTPERDDVDDAMRVYRAVGLGFVPRHSLVWAVGAVAVGVAAVVIHQFVVAILFAVAAATFAMLASRLGSRGMWQNEMVRQPCEAVVAPDALRLSTARATTTWHWFSFNRVVETERSFVLVGPKQKSVVLFTYLPKRAVAPWEFDRLRALLDGVVRPR